MALRTRPTTTITPTETPGRVLLRRRATVYVDVAASAPVVPESEPGVELLETDLVERGWLLSVPLREALVRLDPADLAGLGAALITDADTLLGADRPHVPLFRSFPTGVPANTLGYYVDRVLTILFQAPDQPCVLCGVPGLVEPVNPCGHLVCHACFDGADFSACPICHRRIDLDDPFLRPATERPPVLDPQTGEPLTRDDLPARLRTLHLGTDLAADAATELAVLLARPTALSPLDAADLSILLDLRSRSDLSWVPEAVPGRETKARLVAWLLAGPSVPPGPSVEAVVSRLVDTATDVLRALVVLSGGEPSLLDRPRFGTLSRPVRRLALALLARLNPELLAEDLRRHARTWIRAAERLHPGEAARRHPPVAVAFAALRATRLSSHPAAAFLTAAAADTPGALVAGDRIRLSTFSRRIELSIVDGRVDDVANLLSRHRPGELLRRLDHLLRTARPDQIDAVVAALDAALPRVSAAVLLSALGVVRTRAMSRPTPIEAAEDDPGSRVFFPARGAYAVDEARHPLPPHVVARTVAAIEGELLARACLLEPVERAVVDEGTDQLIVPFAQRSAARAIVTLARGSVLPIPPGRYLRLFCHWMENPGQRVDLDLSVALFDSVWNHVATCDYTNLRVLSDAAVHSGDLTSAPAPLGATEFVDLDVDDLAALARYAVVVVFSYNSVPFLDMAEAFAGWMVRAAPPTEGEIFDARVVEQRFDLTGPNRGSLALVVDLREATMRWIDVAPRLNGDCHAVHRHHTQLARTASAMLEHFEQGSRVSIGELGRLLAAARATSVVVRDGQDGATYRRRDDEAPAAFYGRLRTGPPDDVSTSDGAGLQVLVHGSADVPDGAEVCALYPGPLDPARVRLVDAADLVTQLAPRG
jgi:hypothetical protein